MSRGPSIAGSSDSEAEDRNDPRTSTVRFTEQQTAQEAERTQVRDAFQPASATRRVASRESRRYTTEEAANRLSRRLRVIGSNIYTTLSGGDRSQTQPSPQVPTPSFEGSAPAPADTDVRRI